MNAEKRLKLYGIATSEISDKGGERFIQLLKICNENMDSPEDAITTTIGLCAGLTSMLDLLAGRTKSSKMSDLFHTSHSWINTLCDFIVTFLSDRVLPNDNEALKNLKSEFLKNGHDERMDFLRASGTAMITKVNLDDVGSDNMFQELKQRMPPDVFEKLKEKIETDLALASVDREKFPVFFPTKTLQ